ncbi:hypothetical protein QBZ16_000779 [Prototheca wickerhamii]|uniref:Uncharacterized protein n=1 Tax=Prototheca wickerhamii TaxID=3111 RepID=A0AAD9MMB4_PROWI|nr:hypothetical protein QBZ16_000779 [Prototheca wickerhamii]
MDRRQAPAWASTAAGAIAGAVSRFAVGPLDVLKIRFQVQLEPIAAQAAAGAAASKYTSMRQAVVTIVREEGIQVGAGRRAPRRRGWAWSARPGVAFATGALAGAAGTVASYPFDLLRTTLAAQGTPRVYAGLADAAAGIVRERGPAGLFRGMGITILEILPYSALQFGLYDGLNRACAARRARGQRSVPVDMQHLLCGLAAGLAAKLATHPLDVAKKRRVRADAAARGLRACLAEIYAREGLRGLYKGVGPSVLKAGPSAAITFAAYEVALRWILTLHAARLDRLEER